MHALSASGSLGHHLRTMSGVNISDAAAHERRQGLGWAWFEALFSYILQPLACLKTHPESFYHGMRLLAVDGSQWSLRNTAANIAQTAVRHHNQKATASAFLKWGSAVLLEVGTHQPLAAACVQEGLDHEEGEINIARRVLSGIPQGEDTLLLADRLYGCGRFICDVQAAAGARSQVLVRVGSSRKVTLVRVLSDGSAVIEVRVCRPGSTRTERTLTLREVRGQVSRDHSENNKKVETLVKATEVRLWTTLLDEIEYPGLELLALYAQRWEQELFFRELKRHTGREQLLRAGSVAGAQAEYGAMIIAASLLAEQRVRAAEQVGLPPTRLSITKISRAMEALLPMLSVAGNILSSRQREKIIARFLVHTAREARIPPRRARSCQRGLRKPDCAWPRIFSRVYLDGSCLYALSHTTFP